MKMLSGFRGVPVLAAVALGLPALAASAVATQAAPGARTALGVYEDSASKSCRNVSTCTVVFTEIAVEGGIILSRLQCNFSINTQNGINAQLITLTLSGNGHVSYIRNIIGDTSTVGHPKAQKFELGSNLDRIFAKGEIPTLRATFFGANTHMSIHCNLIGRTEAL